MNFENQGPILCVKYVIDKANQKQLNVKACPKL
jgi:hypothetical protein